MLWLSTGPRIKFLWLCTKAQSSCLLKNKIFKKYFKSGYLFSGSWTMFRGFERPHISFSCASAIPVSARSASEIPCQGSWADRRSNKPGLGLERKHTSDWEVPECSCAAWRVSTRGLWGQDTSDGYLYSQSTWQHPRGHPSCLNGPELSWL